jgi:hypothetical protein
MSTAVEELVSVRPSTAGGFVALINMIERWLRPEMLTTAEAALVDEIKRAARALGAPLLDAESRDDLNDKIERVVMLPEFQRFTESAGKLVILVDPAPVTQSSDEPPAGLVRVVGVGPARIFEQGLRLTPAILSVIAQLAVTEGPPSSSPRPTLAGFFARSGLHSTILTGLLDGVRSSAAVLGLAHAIFEGDKLAPWLALALAETFRDGAYAYLRVLASLGVNVPETIVPLTDRYDIEALQQAYNARMAEIDALLPDHEECEVL